MSAVRTRVLQDVPGTPENTSASLSVMVSSDSMSTIASESSTASPGASPFVRTSIVPASRSTVASTVTPVAGVGQSSQ